MSQTLPHALSIHRPQVNNESQRVEELAGQFEEQKQDDRPHSDGQQQEGE